MSVEQNIIGLGWDYKAFDDETQLVIKNMETVRDLGKQIGSTSIKLGSTGGFTELKTAIDKTNELTAAQQRLAASQKVVEGTEKARVASAQKLTQEQKLQNTVTDSATGSYKQLDAQLKLLLIQYKSLSDQERNSASGRQLQTDILEKNAQLKIFDADLGNYQRNVGNYNSSLGRLSKGIRGLGGLGVILSRALGIDPEVAEGIREAGRAIRDIQHTRELEEVGLKGEVELYEQSKNKIEAFAATTDEAAVAQEGLNTATAANVAETEASIATTKVATITTEAQTIAQEELAVATAASSGATKILVNVLKFSGIALAIAGIAYLVYKIIELNKTSKEAAENAKNLNEIYEDANKSAGEQLTNLSILRQAAEDTNLSMKERLAAVKELQAEFPDYLKNISQEALLNGTAKDSYDALTTSIIQNSLAKAAKDKLDALESKVLDIEFDKQKILQEMRKSDLEGTKANIKDKRDAESRGLDQMNAIYKKGHLQKTLDEKQADEDSLKQQQDYLIKFIGIGKLAKTAETPVKPTKEKKAAVVNESTKEALDLEFELYRISQQRKLRLLDQEASDVKNSFSQRVQFADDYRLASIDLAERTAQHEIEIDKTKLAELEANYKKAKGTEKNNIVIDIENEKKAIVIATAKKNDELLSIEDAFQKRQTQIVKDEQARQLKVYEEAAKSIANVRTQQGGAIEAIRATEKSSHDKLLHDKTITQEKYDKLERKSVNENLILSLQADLRKEESLRKLALLQHQSVVDLDNAITATKAKILSAQNEDLSGNKTLTEQEKRDSIVALAKDATDAIQNLVDIGYQKEIDAIQKIIDLNNERKDQEVASINASTLSAQEKAAQLIILDNAVAANNHKLLVQQNQERVKQAKFDRDMAILKILEDVAGANFKLIAQGGFAGIAAGIGVGLQATAAIAQLLAKPLPTVPAYAKGTDNHPGGPAIVGEAGKELVEPAGGTPFIADRPMLLNNLPKRSRVKPLTSDDIMNGMSGGAAMAMAQRYSQVQIAERNTEVVDAIRETGRATVQAMKKQRGSSTTVVINGEWNAYIRKYVRE